MPTLIANQELLWPPAAAELRLAWTGEGARPHTSPSPRGPVPTRPHQLVERRLAWGARFPAAVHPEPLVGIAAGEIFDDFGELCGIGYDVGLVIAGANQFDCRIKAQDVFAEFRIPQRKAGDDGGVGTQGNAGEAAGGAGGNAEEIDEHALRRGHVGVHENADGFTGAHGGEQAADEIVFVDGAVAVQGAIALNELVDVGIVEGAHDDRQRMTLQRVSESGKLPGSEVAGEKQDAFAASVGALEIFKAVIDDDAGDIFAGVAREEADLGELASEGDEFAANQAAALAGRHFWEGKSQVAQANAAQASVNGVDG